MDVSKLKIKEMDELPEYCRNKKSSRERSELAKIIISAPMGKWIMLSGFKDIRELRGAQARIRNAESLSELVNVKIKTAADSDRKELFFLKLTKAEDDKPEAPRKSTMRWTDGTVKSLPAGVYLEGTEDDKVIIKGSKVA